MNLIEAVAALEALTEGNPQARQALDVLCAAAGVVAPAPAATPRTVHGPAGFVGLLRLPEFFWLYEADESWVPIEREDTALAWSRLLSFGGPGMLQPEQGETWLQRFVHEILPGRWTVQPIADEAWVTLQQGRGRSLSVPTSTAQFQAVTHEGTRQWDFRRGASAYDVLSIIAHEATRLGIDPHPEAALGAGALVEVPAESFASGLRPLSATLDTLDDWLAWTTQLAAQIRRISGRRLLRRDPQVDWEALSGGEQEMWTFWVRNHPGMLRLELSLRDFFASGGQQARAALSLTSGQPSTAFDGAIETICAPGMGPRWQDAIEAWAEEQGVVAIREPARFSQQPPPASVHCDEQGWTVGDADYEDHPHICSAQAEVSPWRVVANPLSQGSYDQHRAAPPAGIRSLD